MTIKHYLILLLIVVMLLGIDIYIMVYLPNVAHGSTTKGLNAECQINNSDKLCDSDLICVSFNDESGNGKCLYPGASPTPKASPTVCPTRTPKPSKTPVATQTPIPTEVPQSTASPAPTGQPSVDHAGEGDGLGCSTHECTNGHSQGGEVLSTHVVVPLGAPATGRAEE